jgi:hypothetical protein
MADLTLSASNGMTPTAQLYLNAAPVGSAISMAEIGTTGEFYADIPSGTAAGEYLVVFFNGTTKLTSGVLIWDGTQEVAPLNSAQTQAAAAAALTSYDPPTKAELDAAEADIIAAVSASSAPSAATVAAAVRTELSTEMGRIDVATSTRLASAGYTAPDNAGVAAIKAKTDNLPSDPADESSLQAAIAAIPAAPSASTVADAVRTELATELARVDVAVSTRNATAPDNAGIAAIKAKTDNLPANTATDLAAIKTNTDLIPAAL